MSNSVSLDRYIKELHDIKTEIETRTGKTTEQLYDERDKRITDTIELRTPDRAPFSMNINIQSYAGIKNSTAYYDPIGWKTAIRKITLDFEPDMCDAGLPNCGAAMTILGLKNQLWPGGPIPTDYEYQFVEGEYMKEDEYDMFLSDPTGFIIRRYLPRVYGALSPLKNLPPLDSMFMGVEMLTPLFTSPEFLEMATRIAEAGRHAIEFMKTIGDSYGELAQLGFPAFAPVTIGGVGGAPFDMISSFLRGMKGSMLDMYRRPEKLLRACDIVLERRMATAMPTNLSKKGRLQRVGIPLWRGDKKFMSEAQFNRFYWPGLKKSLQANIDLGYIAMPFFEAEFGDRLERLLELPQGKMVACVEYVDAFRAREILGGHTCLLVRQPTSSKLWSLAQVEAFNKDLIDKCGKGGGLLLDIRIPDKTPTKDARAMVESIKKYSRY
jgi:hypothetical protein